MSTSRQRRILGSRCFIEPRDGNFEAATRMISSGSKYVFSCRTDIWYKLISCSIMTVSHDEDFKQSVSTYTLFANKTFDLDDKLSMKDDNS